MADLSDLEARISALEDIEAIRQVKAKYWRSLDMKFRDEFGSFFSERMRFSTSA